MLRLVTHIERLLLAHDCVIVPGLGGFVLQAVPAAYSAEEHIFTPMRKSLLFNSTLKHQDGLLAESYMKAYNVNYSKAVEMLGEDVDTLRRRFSESGQIDMGSIGILHKGSEGQYVFTPSEDNLLNVSAYGLPSFYLTPLSLLRREQDDLFISARNPESRRKDDVYIRVNRSVLRAVTAIAAVVVLILLISTPVKNVNPATYTASFIPTGIKPEQSAAVSASMERTVVAVVPDSTREVEPVAEPEPLVISPTPQSQGKIYYAVVGSFPNEESGEKFIKGLDKTQYPTVAYVKKGDKVRVYINKFDNREEAEVYIDALRRTEKHKDAWLFISR